MEQVDYQACVTEYFKASWWRRLFGSYSPQQCMDVSVSSFQAALMMWTMKVMQNAEWDHKPRIRARFTSPTTRRRWLTRSIAVSGLRAFDDESDRVAISLGIQLYEDVPSHVSAKELVDSILMTRGLQCKPV